MPPRRYSNPEADSKLADDRKQKRKESNRNSARKSRERKERYLTQLRKEREELERVNPQIEMRIQMIHSNYLYVDQENDKLKREVEKYSEQLTQLRDLLRLIEMSTGLKLDIPELPDPGSTLKSWKLPLLPLPGVNAVKMFQLVWKALLLLVRLCTWRASLVI